MPDHATDWRPLLREVAARPAPIPSATRALRASLTLAWASGGDELDEQLAAAWTTAVPLVRKLSIAEAIEGLPPGPKLLEALVDAVCAIDHESANVALRLLGAHEPPPLSLDHWRRLCAVAATQRDGIVPDIEAAQLIATAGPEPCLPTVALTVFRTGPEDAEDRELAVAGLGRFADERVLGWLARVAAGGVFGLEAVGGIANYAMHAWEPAGESERAEIAAALAQAAIFAVDDWQRWAAIDVLSRLIGFAASGLAAAAWAAGGEDLETWYLPMLGQRATTLADTHEGDGAAHTCRSLLDRGVVLPPIAPIPSAATRVMARAPRIARRAMVLVESSSAPGIDLAALRAKRAAVEQALVDRRQLLGSFVAPPGQKPADLDARWAPQAGLLGADERARLEAAERAWLGASRR